MIAYLNTRGNSIALSSNINYTRSIFRTLCLLHQKLRKNILKKFTLVFLKSLNDHNTKYRYKIFVIPYLNLHSMVIGD